MDWVLVGRDNLPYDKLKPHQLYEKKLLSYLEFAGKLEKECISYQFINFERLIIEQESVFSDISSFLMSPSSNFEPLLNSTKDSFKTLAYYRDYYVKEQWRKGVECEIEKLAEMVNKDLHRNFGYLI